MSEQRKITSIGVLTSGGDSPGMNAAIRAGEDLWVRGVLLKGNGLCHGITGNSYALHSLFRATKDKKWLNRAYRFCLNLWWLRRLVK